MKNYILLLFIFIQIYCNAQTDAYLGINDTINFKVDNVQNYSKSIINIPVENKKLTILHSISTTCAPCIEHIPALEAYQKQFEKDIQIVLVFNDDLIRINRFKEFVPQLKNTKLPVVTKESGLVKKFQTKIYGSSTWIDQNGVIKSQTTSDLLIPDSIKAFLEDKHYLKSTVYHKINRNLSVLENLKVDPINSLESSFQMFRIGREFQTTERMGWQFEKDTIGRINLIYSYNTDFRAIAKQVLNQRHLHSSRIIFDIKDEKSLIPDFDDKHYNHFAFEIRNTNHERETLKILGNQIENAFGIQFKDTMMNIECYVLKKFKIVDFTSKSIIDLKSITGEEAKFNNKMKSFSAEKLLTLNSLQWGGFIDDINLGNYKGKFDYYIIDESGIQSKEIVDISFYLRPDNMELVNNSLQKYGLVLKKETRPLTVILVKDNDKTGGH